MGYHCLTVTKVSIFITQNYYFFSSLSNVYPEFCECFCPQNSRGLIRLQLTGAKLMRKLKKLNVLLVGMVLVICYVYTCK